MTILTKFFRWIILSKKVNTVHTSALAIGSLYVLVHLAIIIFKESAK